jgi:cell division protein FtsQ
VQSLSQLRFQDKSALALRRDPAPSRWSYRMQRLWLTPFFRVMFRYGLPVIVTATVMGAYLQNDIRRDAVSAYFAQLQQSFEQRPEFRVNYVAVEGASPDLADAVRDALALTLPVSSFDLDTQALQAVAEKFDAVAQAHVRVRTGGVLQVSLIEREPALIWRQGDQLDLIDATGHRVAGLAARGDRADLPVIAGEGAAQRAVEALAILDAVGPMTPRLRGLVRISERRWNLILDRNQSVLLPAINPIGAIERLIALDQAEDILARDILTIDLRDEQRPVLRLAPVQRNEALDASGAIAPMENQL